MALARYFSAECGSGWMGSGCWQARADSETTEDPAGQDIASTKYDSIAVTIL